MNLRLPLLLAGALIAALLFRAWDAGRPEAALPGVAAEVTGRFTADGGWFPGEPLPMRGPVRAWGSWSGDDAHRGRVALGPFPAPARLEFAAGGYPARGGNQLVVELAETGERLPVATGPDIGERWRLVHWEAPASWRGRPVRLIAEDHASGPGGWLALTEPLRGGHGERGRALAVTVAALAWGGLVFLLVTHATRPGRGAGEPRAPPGLPRAAAAEPGPAGGQLVLVLLGLAALLALRKPDALLNPQLWAEDGSVFLVAQEQFGAAALLQPYMGYLHLLPRLTAWSAAQWLDPAWWPAWYNGIAFLGWCGVLARTLSPRLPLPHRPWLALAVIAGPQTGEILGTITNVQWVTALLLVHQTLLRRPETAGQRVGDLLLVAGAGLTGPFIAALLPLFAWKWWRVRDGDALATLLVAGAAATWQLAHLLPAAGTAGAPLDPLPAVVVLARRLLIWPFLGPAAAHGLPVWAVAGAGLTVGPAFLAWVLRPHPRREVRLQLVGAATLLLAAGVLRTRPDTWPGDDLNFADRYFFLPRVLLVWLVILEWDARPRPAAWVARLAVAAYVLLPVPRFILPAAPDYRWREHCGAIRAGTPARIPILPEDWILNYPGRTPRDGR